MKIHGAWWVGIGVFIWLYSLFIEERADTTLTIFYWLAALFTLFGAVRITIEVLKRHDTKKETPAGPPKKEKPHAHGYHHGSAHQTHAHIRNPHGSHHDTHAHAKPHAQGGYGMRHSTRRCPRCHQTIHSQDSVCEHCEQKL